MNDGLINGYVYDGERRKPCGHCGLRQDHTIVITSFQLPEGIEPSPKLIGFKSDGEQVDQLGIECGCYASFHRQVTHIKERMKK